MRPPSDAMSRRYHLSDGRLPLAEKAQVALESILKHAQGKGVANSCVQRARSGLELLGKKAYR